MMSCGASDARETKMRVEMETIGDDTPQLRHDPVCGREISAGQELLLTDLGGVLYPFCSERCRMRFALHPERYMQGRSEDRCRAPR